VSVANVVVGGWCEISGPVTVTDHSDSVTQNVVASGNAAVQQAGRDIHNGPPTPR
jgi:hypothetical protein